MGNLIARGAYRVPLNWRRETAVFNAKRRVPGLPDGLSREVLDEVARKVHGASVTSTSFEHLSNWKPTGAYRVVTEVDNKRWTVVFKNADYALESVPAQSGLPAVIGRPEHRVMVSAYGQLLDYLPAVYWADQVEDRQCYRFLLGDLHWSWYRPQRGPDLLAAAASLPGLHSALAAVIGGDDSGLIRYDAGYSEALRSYVADSVEQFLSRHTAPSAEEAWQSWPSLVAAHREAAPRSDVGQQPIHGDFNTANLYLHWRARSRLKAVDWEWAGIGYPHTDLASVLKHASPEAQERGLEAFSAAYGERSPSEHRVIYAWCRLQDAIRDAGYVAAQFLDFAHVPRVDPPGYVAGALGRAQAALRMLEAR